MEPKEVIESIRRDKFYLYDDVVYNANPLVSDLQNAVSQLSEGLYKKETHFLFELIQNAEDNTYPEHWYYQFIFDNIS